MIRGIDVINALKNCNNQCSKCVASYKGTSCKEHQAKIEQWQKERREKFAKRLSNGVR